MVKIVKKTKKGTTTDEKWKILVVDDEEDVHSITKLVLNDFTYRNKSLQLISCYSGNEAREELRKQPDISVILLDVVMETDEEGLKLVEFICNEMKCLSVRIILRTAQPGIAPEREVIDNYDIDDYKTKAELTAQKLYTAVRSALKNYSDIMLVEVQKQGLQKVVEATNAIFKLRSLKEFLPQAFNELVSILVLNKALLDNQVSGFVTEYEYLNEADDKTGSNSFAEDAEKDYTILAGKGIYEDSLNKKVREVIDEEIIEKIDRSFKEKKRLDLDNHLLLNFQKENDEKCCRNFMIFIKGNKRLEVWEEKLIEIFRVNILAAIDNVCLNREIEDTQKELIYTLGMVGESRSKETANHVRRVAKYSKVLALKYGLAAEEAALLEAASPMHDIGKIGIPDSVLNKPGKLTVDEFKIIKRHPEIGHSLLNGSKRKIFKAAAIIALRHQEKWNGSGYPGNLVGDKIHIYGRITALADVFDALGSHRCYKKAWELDRILKLVEEEKNKHFDPELVDIFLSNLDEFLAIRDVYEDVI
tara:strand:- start:2385 stop:3977 length:1593 start_codon:yes stop_codon:yes gene_type:complete